MAVLGARLVDGIASRKTPRLHASSRSKYTLRSIIQSVGTLVIGNAISQAIYVLGFLFLSRLYDPQDFGEYAVVFAIGSIAGAVASMRLELSILLAKNPWQSNIASVSSLAVGNVVLLLLSATIALTSLVTNWVWTNYCPEIFVIAASYLFTNVCSFTQNRKKRYGSIIFLQIARSISFVALSAALYFTTTETNNLILGATISSALLLAITIKMEFSSLFKIPRFRTRFISLWIKRHSDIPKYSSLASLIGSVAYQAPLLLLSFFYGDAAAGIYTLVQRLINQPVQLLSGALNRVYLQSISQRRSKGQALLPFSIRLLKGISPLAALGALLAAAASYFGLFSLIFGPQWHQLDTYVWLLTPVLFTAFIARSIAGFGILGHNKTGLLYQTVLLAATAASIVLSKWTFDSLDGAICFLSLTTSVVYAGQIWTTLSITKNLDTKVA